MYFFYQQTLSKYLSNIKAALLWVTPAVVTESWHYFIAWFYHYHQILNREISGPSECDKSKKLYSESGPNSSSSSARDHFSDFSDLEAWICTISVIFLSWMKACFEVLMWLALSNQCLRLALLLGAEKYCKILCKMWELKILDIRNIVVGSVVKMRS